MAYQRPKYGDRAACRLCDSYIEWVGKWWDRAGNIHCPDGKRHKPFTEHHARVLESGRRHLARNRKAMRELARR